MKPSLQLKMGQQLTMTPQLQQAIRLLQLSTLDLQQEIQEALESNTMLEPDEPSTDVFENNTAVGEHPVDFTEAATDTDATNDDQTWSEHIPNDLPVDSGWEDVYSSLPPAHCEDDFDLLSRSQANESLHDHLEWQLNLMPFSTRDCLLGLGIIESINSDGYLTYPLEDLHTALSQQIDDLDLEELQVIKRYIQRFDPVGCGSADLKECLLVQLEQLPGKPPLLKEAINLINNHLNSLGCHDYALIMRRTRLKEPQLRDVLTLIQSLNPKPGADIGQDITEYVTPDVSVKQHKDRWVVELNADSLPRLRINRNYAAMVQRANTSRDNLFMKNQLKEARWFIKNLQSRHDTLLKVTTKIVEFQRAFLEQGEAGMKPLILADIAEAVDMHESTISRVTTQKYLHTPRGIFELKYFFSSHVGTDSGGECSSTAIRAFIKKLIAEENTRKPLSDNKISGLLGEQGIKVARRTIAKYRESMNIPPSNERKQLI